MVKPFANPRRSRATGHRHSNYAEKSRFEGGWRIGPRTQDRTSRRALRDGQQVRREIRLPTGQQPLLAGLAGAETVAPIGFLYPREAAAGSVPICANAFQRKMMALCRLPIDAGETRPLRGGARRRTEECGQLLQARRCKPGARHAEIVVIGLVEALAGPQLGAQQLDLRRLVGKRTRQSPYWLVPMGCLTVASPGSLRR